MAAKRTRTEEETAILCFKCLAMALAEPPEMKKRWRTDAIGIALQFAGAYRPKVKRKDFEIIENKTLNEIIEILTPH